MLLCVLLLTTLLAPNVMAAGEGGGTQVPTLEGIAVSSVSEATATVRFSFSNNIGADGSYNRQFFYLKDEAGKNLEFTMKFWAGSTDPNRRVAQMNISSLQPQDWADATCRLGCSVDVGCSCTARGRRTLWP